MVRLITTPDKLLANSNYGATSERETWLMGQIDALNKQLVEQKAEHLDREKRLMALLESNVGKKRFGFF